MQHILITGGNAGIGKATAEALAALGNTVIIACRKISQGDLVAKEITKTTANSEVFSIQCDLSSFDSIRACSETFKDQFGKLDILINNAGTITDTLQFTQDGFELQFGVNHLGHFLLTNELLPLLHTSQDPRIINVSSNAHYKGKINLNTFRGEIGHKKYKGMAAYSQSKLANVLFTKELARRYPSICSHSLHPGVVRTNIASKNDNNVIWKFIWNMFKPIMLSKENGAKTSVYLATSQEAIKSNGKYFHKQKETKPSALADDINLAKELWEISNKLVSLN